MFSNPFPEAFGLDVGDLSIKLVQLRNAFHFGSEPSYEIVTARSISLPYGLIVNGELQKPELVRHYIIRLLEGNKQKHEKKITSPWLVASLPETQGFIKLITINKPEEEIIEDDIILEVEKHIPFTKEEGYYFDWQILTDQEKNNQTPVLVGAIPKLIADSYTYLFESLKLGIKALEIEAISIIRSMITATKDYKNEARAILDLGATRSSLIIYDKDQPQFSTSIPFSGELITTAIAQRLNTSYEEAEYLKKKYGLEYQNNPEGKKVWFGIVNLTEKLIENIKSDLCFYYSHFPEPNKVTHITMSGGSSNLKGLDKLLTDKLEIECLPGHPWKNLLNKRKINLEEKDLNYATSIGLAIRAADNPMFSQKII